MHRLHRVDLQITTQHRITASIVHALIFDIYDQRHLAYRVPDG